MKSHGYRRTSLCVYSVRHQWWRVTAFSVVFLAGGMPILSAQTSASLSLQQKIQQLTDDMTRAQVQIQESQRQLDEMRGQLKMLQEQMVQDPSKSSPQPFPDSASAVSSSSPARTEPSQSDLQEIHDRLAVQEAQIATHEQAKVESESKYPIKVTGLLLLNGFVNAGAVDIASTPTLAVHGSGSTGGTVRQTVLGIDAFGPHLFGATSHADLRVDFAGSPQSGNTSATYTGYSNSNSSFLRLRTVHAGLQWQHTEAYFSLDHPIFSSDSPTSLTAVAEPALAWSGNLWTWNPQLGITQDFAIPRSRRIRLQAALMDAGDPPVTPPVVPSTGATPPSTAEQSRWPGTELHLAFLSSESGEHNRIGLGGYFAPHLTSFGRRYDSWAGTLDTHLLLPMHLEMTASFYRGLALGSLGGGGYKNFAFRRDPDTNGYYFRPLNDVGGWAQLKKKLNERIEFNAAVGIDNVFANDLRPYAAPGGNIYQNLARNRTYTGNVIYSPSAYLLFSIEYRHLQSFPITGSPAASNIIGLAAGYKF